MSQNPSRHLAALLVGASWLLATPVLAHDFWIEPSSFRPAPGTPVGVHLRVGVAFAGDPVPRVPLLIERFGVVHGGRESVLRDLGRTDPAGVVAPSESGPYWLVYQSRAWYVELEARAFEAYLLEEGLESIVARRAELGESERDGNEAFYRGAKSVLCAGAELSPEPPEIAGMSIEIVPETDLCAARSGSAVPFRVLFRGDPVAGLLLVGIPRDDPAGRVAVRTDGDGRGTLELGRPGVWLVKAVHMVRADPGLDVDWESYWASLTFQILAGGR